ncbi:MAG: hypothetical protein J3Q66DRAFT_342664 [Benniella sp.]|nr:MAG: hypothetical protein J3Q66DRAFT_342664 [Benniella sp.]
MPIRSVVVALYNYEANTEQELSIKENDILYILDDADPNWWKAKLKTPDSNGLQVGLVPSNYVEPLPSIGTVIGLYSYKPTTEEYLTLEKGDTLTLYEQDDQDWLLVGNGSQVGFVPRNYVEVSAGQEDDSQDQTGSDGRDECTEDREDEDQYEEPTQFRFNTPTVRVHTDKHSTKIWDVNEVDKKKKKKGHLAIDNRLIIFGSEVDKSPVRLWMIEDVDKVRHKKRHVYLDIGGASPASLDFQAVSEQEAEAIFNKIQESRTTRLVASAAVTSLVRRSVSTPTRRTVRGWPNQLAAPAAVQPGRIVNAPGNTIMSASRTGEEATDTRISEADFEWFSFFIKAGVAAADARRYSPVFRQEKIDLTILPDLTRDALKDLKVNEGDIVRIKKAVNRLRFKIERSLTRTRSTSRHANEIYLVCRNGP